MYTPGIYSINPEQRLRAERQAANGKIQGTGADVMKIWLRRIWDRLNEESPTSKLALTVHDEAVAKCHEAEVILVGDIMIETMEGMMPIPLPVEVDKPSKRWA